MKLAALASSAASLTTAPRFLRRTLPKLFENGGHTDTQEGIGLGLAIVKQSIEAHGGEISAKSDDAGHDD